MIATNYWQRSQYFQTESRELAEENEKGKRKKERRKEEE